MFEFATELFEVRVKSKLYIERALEALIKYILSEPFSLNSLRSREKVLELLRLDVARVESEFITTHTLKRLQEVEVYVFLQVLLKAIDKWWFVVDVKLAWLHSQCQAEFLFLDHHHWVSRFLSHEPDCCTSRLFLEVILRLTLTVYNSCIVKWTIVQLDAFSKVLQRGYLSQWYLFTHCSCKLVTLAVDVRDIKLREPIVCSYENGGSFLGRDFVLSVVNQCKEVVCFFVSFHLTVCDVKYYEF